jgi:alpha-1,2-mannosyltransferase
VHPIPAPSRVLRVCYALLLLGAAFVAVSRGLEQAVGGDFEVFWSAGGRFWRGEPLYAIAPGARGLIYPPFAAFVFQPLHLLPLVPSAVAFGLLNVVLLVVLYRLTIRIVTATLPERRPGHWPFVVALVLAHAYLLNNLNLVQVNVVITVLVLWGVAMALDGRERGAAFPLVAAAAVKVMPAIFVGWLVIRRPRAAIPAAFLAGALVVALPMVQRGPSRGMGDLREYYHAFLADFQGGRVVADYTNQNLAAAVERMSRPVTNRERLDYRWLPLPEGASKVLRNGLALLVVVTLVAAWLHAARRGMPVSAWELAAGFLAWHLVSGITWKSHLVTYVFLAAVFLAAQYRHWPRPGRWAMAVAVAALAITAFIGRDIVGRTAHYYIGGWSILTWMMVLMFAIAAWRTVAPRKPAPSLP